MKILRTILATSVLATSILAMSMCPPASASPAEVFYPRGPCRIYIDTDFVGLPNQCGTVMRVYSRRTFQPHLRRLFPSYGPDD